MVYRNSIKFVSKCDCSDVLGIHAMCSAQEIQNENVSIIFLFLHVSASTVQPNTINEHPFVLLVQKCIEHYSP